MVPLDASGSSAPTVLSASWRSSPRRPPCADRGRQPRVSAHPEPLRLPRPPTARRPPPSPCRPACSAACSAAPAAAALRPTARDAGRPGRLPAFPVTIEHAFGETDDRGAAERVVDLGLGQRGRRHRPGRGAGGMPPRPTAATRTACCPWTAEALEEAGAEIPTVLAETEEPPYEEIAEADARPDPGPLLRHHRGAVRAAQRDRPDRRLPRRGLVDPVARGRHHRRRGARQDRRGPARARRHRRRGGRAAPRQHPEFDGQDRRRRRGTSPERSTSTQAADPRVEFIFDLGLVSAPASTSWPTASRRSTTPSATSSSTSSPATSSWPTPTPEEEAAGLPRAHARRSCRRSHGGAVATIVGAEFVASVSPPTALSLTWGIDDYVEVLSEAANAADAS